MLKNLNPQVALTTFRAALATDFRSVYRRVHTPTLVLQSHNDPAVTLDVARWIASAMPSAHLVELNSTGHFPHIADPAEVITAIRNFVSG